jgi:uncharacterized RDD family membrane protein YckC
MPLFEGPASLRDPGERLAFWGTAVCALPAALAIGYVLHESIGVSQVALFIVVAMVYVTLARGRLLGSSVRVHEAQYPRVFAIVKGVCAALEIPMPLVFVREDNFVPVAALGFGEPYSLVLSSHWIEVFADDELAFAVGRELGHIAAGHTRFLSLLSVNGNENPLVSLIFGAWLRRCTLTCDKIGLLCTGSLEAAIRAMGVAAFHEFARKVDFDVFAEQQTEIESDTIFRWGVWLGSEPYATYRIASLRAFMKTPAYAAARAWFERERTEEPPALSPIGTAVVEEKDCAGWWRRFAAATIDVIVVSAIIGSFAVGSVSDTDSDVSPTPSPSSSPSAQHGVSWKGPSSAKVEHAGPIVFNEKPDAVTMNWGPFAYTLDDKTHSNSLTIGGQQLTPELLNPANRFGRTFWLGTYMALLVAVAGQTFGMMIAGLRVVTTDFRKPGLLRSIARYAIAFTIWWLIIPLSFFKRRVLLHDRWTKTRLVKVERVVARATGTA